MQPKQRFVQMLFFCHEVQMTVMLRSLKYKYINTSTCTACSLCKMHKMFTILHVDKFLCKVKSVGKFCVVSYDLMNRTYIVENQAYTTTDSLIRTSVAVADIQSRVSSAHIHSMLRSQHRIVI